MILLDNIRYTYNIYIHIIIQYIDIELSTDRALAATAHLILSQNQPDAAKINRKGTDRFGSDASTREDQPLTIGLQHGLPSGKLT